MLTLQLNEQDGSKHMEERYEEREREEKRESCRVTEGKVPFIAVKLRIKKQRSVMTEVWRLSKGVRDRGGVTIDSQPVVLGSIQYVSSTPYVSNFYLLLNYFYFNGL